MGNISLGFQLSRLFNFNKKEWLAYFIKYIAQKSDIYFDNIFLIASFVDYKN